MRSFIKGLLLVFLAAYANKLSAQVYLDGIVTIQSGVTFYAQDNIQVPATATVSVQGILQSTTGLSVVSPNYLQMAATGSVISPAASGVTTLFDVGINSNNRITILQSTGAPVSYQVGIKTPVYLNPDLSSTPVSSGIVSRMWSVSPLTNSGATTLTLYWNATEESTFNRLNCDVALWKSTVNTNWTNSALAASTITGSNPAFSRPLSVASLTTGTYYFALADQTHPLPIIWEELSLTAQNNDAKLNWTVANESNTSHYEIERSFDGKNFEKTGNINAVANSSTEQSYSYTDPLVLLNNNDFVYYRIKQILVSADYKYSQVRSLRISDKTPVVTLATYPNPANNMVYYTFKGVEEGTYEISLYDMLGRRVYNVSQDYSGSVIDGGISANTVKAGLYILTLQNKSGIIETKKITVQHN